VNGARTRPARPPRTPLAELAELAGVQPAYEGADGRTHRADDDVLLAILRALGVQVERSADVVGVLAHERARRARRVLEPVLVHRVGHESVVALTLPSAVGSGGWWVSLEMEDGTVHRTRLSDLPPATLHPAAVDPLALCGGAVPPGYHRLVVEGPGLRETALLVAAPRCPSPVRGWGAFLPLHAVRAEDDRGVGTFSDLAELGAWVAAAGGSMVGTLPLLPQFLEPPVDPSPYLPVTRFGVNELYVDPTALPELAVSPEAKRLVEDGSRSGAGGTGRSALVDYEAVASRQRQILDALAATLFAGPSARRQALDAFATAHPEVVAYARFRAAGEVLGRDWHAWPAVSPGRAPEPPGSERAFRSHLYAQWVADEQLARAAGAAPLYADLPVGVHPLGADPFFDAESFTPGIHGGAPPDPFFEAGQDWGFSPLHPRRLRDREYDYVVRSLRHAFSHASYLRIDHVMGLERLYWIPEGGDARHGTYVSYRAEELHAIVALEAHRADAVVVGEDLGTVPPSVRRRMADDGMLRSWVLEFETSPDDPLPPAPTDCLASWGTHDLPRFRAYWSGRDIDTQVEQGHLSSSDADLARSERERWRRSFLAADHAAANASAADRAAANTSAADHAAASTIAADHAAASTIAADHAAAMAAYRACLGHLAGGDAALVLVELEDLWGEETPQNEPGTGTERPNWRLRAARTLTEMRTDPDIAGMLAGLDRARGARPGGEVGRPPSEGEVAS
jgi:4-alpha-glucanotransferase